MKIIDTNGVNYIFVNKLSLTETYFLVPDVKEESEVTELVHSMRMPKELTEIVNTGLFNEAVYINHYNLVLNKYSGTSFFNMTGFGDISILATVHMLLDMFSLQQKEQLFDLSEIIEIFTDDVVLAIKINKEFVGKNVVVRPTSDIS